MPTRERGAASVETLALLWAARETGVLDALLTSAGDPADIAAETDTTERAVRATIDALATEGFLERVGESHEPTNRALGLLAKTDVRSIGRLPHALDRFDALASLPETMRTGDPPDRSDDWTRNRLGAVAATDESTVRACVTAAVRERPAADRVLDVGGAPGTYAKEFVARGFDVTLVDRSEAVEVSRPFLAHEPVDLVTDDEPLPEADLAFVPAADRRRPADGTRDLIDRLSDALAPDGTVVVVDRLADRSPGATADAIAALATGESGPRSAAAYREWLDAGFESVDVRDVPGTDRQAVTGSKRAID
ncbi:methyltransferase domain-containing protein [Halostella sp. JP-L12]|uniref:class I SAM-dependent methyltransferase n=1 Tax=Halostella TaxID=1843185 RepID=UPI000EF7E74B|nr:MULTISPECIES: methyltransferase domain-containing protein [Halostella]NHN48256.1 methyltransferase domain-containing protein [Halostella sp. JP-L12]